jgi:hypothetical protein
MSLTIGERLDRLPLSRRHFVIAAIVGVGILFDFYEVFLAGTLATVLEEDFAVTGTQADPRLGIHRHVLRCDRVRPDR